MVAIPPWASPGSLHLVIGESNDPGEVLALTVHLIQRAPLVRNCLGMHFKSIGKPINVAPQIVPRDEINQQEVDDPAYLGRRHTVEGRLQVDVATRTRHVTQQHHHVCVCTAKKIFLVRLFFAAGAIRLQRRVELILLGLPVWVQHPKELKHLPHLMRIEARERQAHVVGPVVQIGSRPALGSAGQSAT